MLVTLRSVTTKNLILTNGAQVYAGTLGKGNAGTITITADNVRFDGVGSNEKSSGAFSIVGETAKENSMVVTLPSRQKT